MNLLVLHSQLGILRGGGENFSRNLFTSFAARGHAVRIVFAADPFGRYPFPLPPSVEPIPIRGWWFEAIGQATLSAVGRRMAPDSTLRRKWDYAQSALAWRTFYWSNRHFHRRVMQRIEQLTRDIDAVYVHSNSRLASDVARVRPTVLRLPGPLTSEAAPVLRSVHAVCANGDALRQMRLFLGDHISELPVGLDEARFSPGPGSERSTLGWGAEHKVIGYVGRLSHIKGVDLLAQSFRIVSRNDPAARLLVVGTGEETANLRATLAAEIAAGLVRMVGDVSHERLPGLFRCMDLLVMPSRYENFSNAVLEAFACGVPFVGSDVGGNRAMYEGGAGWLFEASSAMSLARVLQEALSDRRELRTRGDAALRYVRGRYSWHETAVRLECLMSSLLGGATQASVAGGRA
jgi:glycosyltransferase involved in cell wall biosynthesis